MVSANDKGKKPEEDDPHKPKEEEILVGYEGDMEEDKQPHSSATVASIGLVSQPTQLRRTTRMSTGGRTPRHILAPRTLPPSTPCSNHAGKKHSNKEERRKNNKDWNCKIPPFVKVRIPVIAMPVPGSMLASTV